MAETKVGKGELNFDAIYPVGCIYLSVNPVNPSTLFGGTWTAFATGRTIVGVDMGQTEFDTVEETGGDKTHIHGLAAGAAQIGSDQGQADTIAFRASQNGDLTGTIYSVRGTQDTPAASRSHNTALTGTTDAGSTLQPYITVYMWKRTA